MEAEAEAEVEARAEAATATEEGGRAMVAQKAAAVAAAAACLVETGMGRSVWRCSSCRTIGSRSLRAPYNQRTCAH